MKQVLLADDHALMLEGVAGLLRSEFEIVGSVADGRSLVEAAERLKPDLVVLDISMPEMNGIEAARRIRQLVPAAKLVFVTQQLDPAYVRAAFEAGAMAYVAKQSAANDLRHALRQALAGRFYVTPLVQSRDPHLISTRSDRLNPATMFGRQLTARQRETLQLIAEGKSAKEIASALNISVKTVEFHRNALMNELGIRTTAELTRYALSHGIVAD